MNCWANDIYEITAYDPQNLLLYVSIHQIFRIWAIPFFSAPVSLVTVLQLVKQKQYDPPRYLIRSQNDLYQVNEFVKFVSQFGILSALVIVLQLMATMGCVLGAMVFWPISWLEQNVIGGNRERSLVDAVNS